MLSLIRKFFRLGRDRAGTAALEFALIAGIFLVPMFYGVYDITEEVIYYQEVYNAAHSIAASASNLAAQANGTTTLTYTQIQFLESEIWGEIPSLRGDYQDGNKSVTISSIVFQPNFASTTTCAAAHADPCYVPLVIWSVTYAGGNSVSHNRTWPSGLPTSTATRHLEYVLPTNTGGAVYGLSSACASEDSTRNTDNIGTSGTSQCFANVNGNNNYNDTAVANNPLRPCDTFPTMAGIIFNYAGGLNQTTPTGGSKADYTNLPTLTLTSFANSSSTLAPPAPIIVVDVHLQYTPPIDLVRYAATDFYVSAYWPVRSVQTVVTGTTTPLSLYNQFTTISESSVYNDTTQTTVVPITLWCVNSTLQGATVQ